MISRKDRDAMMKFVEGSRQDKMRDKSAGYAEKSMADMGADSIQAKKLLVRGNKNQMPPKGWPK